MSLGRDMQDKIDAMKQAKQPTGQTLILSPKDNLGKITLNNVQTYALEGETLLVVFLDGSTRNYPLMHLWYYSSHVSYHGQRNKGQEN